jgi:hypothetical protein
MPFALPRDMTTQAGYRQQLNDRSLGGVPAPYAPPTPPSPPPDPATRLRQLGELHASGALTDDEFATAKSQVLGER